MTGRDGTPDLLAEEVVDGEVVDGAHFALVPYSPGEVVDLEHATDTQLASVLSEAKEFEYQRLRAFKREVQEEILRRMDAAAGAGVAGAWTIHAEDGYKLEGDSPDRTDYDVDELRDALTKLVEGGKIAPEAISQVIVPDGWKVAKRPLVQLVKLGGQVRDTVESCRRPVTRARSVRVSQELRRERSQ